MVNAHSATYPHVTFFTTSETNYLPWDLLTVTTSTTTRSQYTSSSPILSWCCPLGNRLEDGVPDPYSVLQVAVSVISFLNPLISLENLVDICWIMVSNLSYPALSSLSFPLTSPCPALEQTYKLQTSSSQWRVSCAASQFYKVLSAVHLKSW